MKNDIAIEDKISDPILVDVFPFLYYTCDRDPTSTEPVISSIPFPSLSYFFWWNKITNDVFDCIDVTAEDLKWNKRVSNLNFLSVLQQTGIIPPISRVHTSLSSPEFGTSYQPSIINDVEITVNIGFSAVLSLSCEIDLDISEDNINWTTICKIKRQFTLASNLFDCITKIIPVSSYFRIIQTGSGGSIDSIFYLNK